MAGDLRPNMRIVLDLAVFRYPAPPQNLESGVFQPNSFKRWLYPSPADLCAIEWSLSVL